MIGRSKVIIAVLVGLIIISSCSTTKKVIKNKSITLSKNYYKSKDSNLLIKIPSGWNEVKDNSEKLFDFWLVSPDKNSTIVFVPITFNSENKLPNDRITLEFLSETTKKLKKNTIKNFQLVNNIQTYKINNLWFNGFSYKITDKERKSILLGNKNKFYECIAYFNEDYNPTRDELEYLFKIQNLVLSTIQIK